MKTRVEYPHKKLDPPATTEQQSDSWHRNIFTAHTAAHRFCRIRVVREDRDQTLITENGSYNPVNLKAPFKGKAAEEQDKMNSILKTVAVLGWDVINAERPEWNRHWSRIVER